MANLHLLFSNFLTFFILLFPLNCFIHHRHRRRDPLSVRLKAQLAASKATLLYFLKHLFSSKSAPPQPPPPSSRAVLLSPITPNSQFPNHSPTAHRGGNIHPCTVCGEIFQSPPLLDLHHSTSHHVSDVADGENILRIIFKTGWPETAAAAPGPAVHRILKIHNHPKTLARFEEYRECVKSRAATPAARDERCAADGNELLRFYCATFVCDLDGSICGQQYCSLCGIIRSGFSPKMDGIPTLPTSHAAHLSVPEDVEEEFKFMHVRRAMLVCRIIAGRVGSCGMGLAGNKDGDPGFDSVTGGGDGGEEDELLVFNPRAVLPCFVILYTV